MKKLLLIGNFRCVSKWTVITPMLGEHVTRAHAGTRHVSHGEHAPLAYSVSRSLSQSLTPAFRSSPCLSLSCYIFFFLSLFLSLFYLYQIRLEYNPPSCPPISDFLLFLFCHFLFAYLMVLFFLATVINFAFFIFCLTIYIILFLFIIVIFSFSLVFSIFHSFLCLFYQSMHNLSFIFFLSSA